MKLCEWHKAIKLNYKNTRIHITVFLRVTKHCTYRQLMHTIFKLITFNNNSSPFVYAIFGEFLTLVCNRSKWHNHLVRSQFFAHNPHFYDNGWGLLYRLECILKYSHDYSLDHFQFIVALFWILLRGAH